LKQGAFLLKVAIPVFHVFSSADAVRFYCDKLGFRHEFSHRAVATHPDPCYSGISRDGVWLHISSFSGDAVAGGVTNIVVDNVDGLHAELLAKGVPIHLAPVNQTWGTREMYVKDADGNCLRFQQM
jgi:uncharacterized glyoxalase superfamily protein PhnB